MFYKFGYGVMKILRRLLCGLRVVGREQIPQQGPFLLVSNHLSAMDPPLIMDLIPSNMGITGLAGSTHRNDFFLGWGMSRWGVIWVDRGSADREALRQVLDVLASGRPVGVAPEGTRSDTGALIKGKTGVAYLALQAQVRILPMAITGSEKVFPSLLRLRRATVNVKIGPLFRLPPRGDGSRREHVQYCTDLIMTRLASMLPERYRGVYAGDPLIDYWEQLDADGSSQCPAWRRDLIPV